MNKIAYIALISLVVSAFFIIIHFVSLMVDAGKR